MLVSISVLYFRTVIRDTVTVCVPVVVTRDGTETHFFPSCAFVGRLIGFGCRIGAGVWRQRER
jgi:hypothetical protein